MLPLMADEENKENTATHMLIFSETQWERMKQQSWLFTKGEWEEEGGGCREWRTLI